MGDWDGDGTTTLGVVDPKTETWSLKNSIGPGAPDIAPFRYGSPGWAPVVGDWDGDGTTTIGVVDPATLTWHLRNSNSPGAPDIAPFAYGSPGSQPVAGYWNGREVALVAAGSSAALASPPVDSAAVQPIVAAALTRLADSGVDAGMVKQLAGTQVVVQPLSGQRDPARDGPARRPERHWGG